MCTGDHRRLHQTKISREGEKLSSSEDVLTGWSSDGRVNTGEYHWTFFSFERQMLRCSQDCSVLGFCDHRINFFREECKPGSSGIVLTVWSDVALVWTADHSMFIFLLRLIFFILILIWTNM